jgi:hypothetical protein
LALKPACLLGATIKYHAFWRQTVELGCAKREKTRRPPATRAAVGARLKLELRDINKLRD